MKVLLITPWANAWVPYFRAEFEKRGHTFALAKAWNCVSRHDVVIHGWARNAMVPGAKNVVFLRRYELFDGAISKMDWKHVDQLICVNDWIADRVRETFNRDGINVPVAVIYNGVDTKAWRFAQRKAGPMIGMACHVHPKKNLPVALNVLAMLPEDYELHIAGDIQDPCTAEYLNHVGKCIQRKIYLYGHIPHAELDLWWEQMNYCLSSSISEGNPNNVLEAMAKGIKPLIHDWPGAHEQFPPELRFSSISDAVQRILHEHYDSSRYRELVEDRFGLQNYTKVADLCESLVSTEYSLDDVNDDFATVFKTKEAYPLAP